MTNGDLEHSGLPAYSPAPAHEYGLFAWCALFYAFVDERIYQFCSRLRTRLPMLLWRAVASGLRKLLLRDRVNQEVSVRSELESSSYSRGWCRDRWIHWPFGERYENLLGYLTSLDRGCSEDLIEHLEAWEHLMTDFENLRAFSKSPEPFDRYPIGEVRLEINRQLPEIYKAIAQIGLRLGADRLRLGVTSPIPLFRYFGCRCFPAIGARAVACLQVLDRLRCGFRSVVWSPIIPDDGVEPL